MILSRKTKFVLLLLSVSITSFGQSKNPYSKIKYDKVVFYDFIIESKGLLIMDENGKYLQSIIKKVELDKSTISKLNYKLGDKKSFGAGTAACFDPHCGFVYFYKNIPVAQITICLGCNALSSTIELPAQEQGKQGKGKDAYFISDGMSKSFRKFINGLLIKHKFSNQIKPGSMFDK